MIGRLFVIEMWERSASYRLRIGRTIGKSGVLLLLLLLLLLPMWPKRTRLSDAVDN